MLTTFKTIKNRFADAGVDLVPGEYPEAISELADSEVPIYYSEIIDEWRELPMEHSNRFSEIGVDDDFTITQLMQIDLYIYYREQFEAAYNELCEELEEMDDN